MYKEDTYICGLQARQERAMIIAKLRRTGNSVVVTIPPEELERLGLVVGQQVAVEVQPVTVRPALRPELQESMERLLPVHAEALRYLADK